MMERLLECGSDKIVQGKHVDLTSVKMKTYF